MKFVFWKFWLGLFLDKDEAGLGWAGVVDGD